MEKLEEEKAKFKKALIGFVTTFITALTAKAVILIFNSATVTDAINGIWESTGFLFSAMTSALAGGYFAQKDVAVIEDCDEIQEESK